MIRTMSKRSIGLLCADLVCVLVSYVISSYLWIEELYPNYIFLISSLLIYPILYYIFDFYHPYRRYSKYRTFFDAFICVSLGCGILAAASYLDRTLLTSRFIFMTMALFLAVFLAISRLSYDNFFKGKYFEKKCLILGLGDCAAETIKMIKETVHSGIEIVGVVSPNDQHRTKKCAGTPILGTVDDLSKLVDQNSINMLIIATEPENDNVSLNVLEAALEKDVQISSAVTLYENMRKQIPYKLLSYNELVQYMSALNRRPYLRIKRMADIISSLILIVCLFPLILIVIISLFIMDRHNPFYSQMRVGKNGKSFKLYKLKTMKVRHAGKLTVTKLGRWLRRYRIDEIPQLINVLIGDMSLVGPRPEIEYFVKRSRKLIPFYETVFALKPGLTGWAQVMFRHATSTKDYEHKFRYNLFYLKNVSFALDLLILLKTIRTVVLGKGK